MRVRLCTYMYVCMCVRSQMHTTDIQAINMSLTSNAGF